MMTSADYGHLDVLGTIPSEYRAAVLGQCIRKEYRKGENVWNAGNIAKCMAFIGRGKTISLCIAHNGRGGAIGIWCAGDILGGASIFDPGRRQTTMVCLEETVIYWLPLNKVYEITRRFPEVGDAILNALSSRLRWSNRLTFILQTLPAFKRICAILVSLAERFSVQTSGGVLIDIALTHDHLAAMVGLTRQFTTITLHELQDRGLIVLRRKKIILKDIEALRRIVPVL